jgi:tRNA pseudouridine55 synthase
LLKLRIRCSKGTYVRTLAEDIGEALGTCAHLAALRRIASGQWRLDNAVTLDALAAMPESMRAQHLLPLSALLAGLPRAELDAEQEARFRNGQTLKAFSDRGLCAVYAKDGSVIGLGETDANGALRPRRLVAAPVQLVAPSQAADKHRKTL